MRLPKLTYTEAVSNRSRQYGAATRRADTQGVTAQSRMTCAFKAGRLAGRCLSLGFNSGDCYAAAADFNQFCNDLDL